MSSRAPDERLDTSDSRRRSLNTHINHGNWTPTPYVSFTSSPEAIEQLVLQRQWKRGAQTLTVIDPNVRLRKGLPILDLKQEVEHYKIPNPYGRQDQYCVDHYICLWQVTDEEIIGHWKWDELAGSKTWYEDTIMPAFRIFNQTSKQRVDDTGLSEIMDRLRLRGEWADGDNHISRLADSSSDEISYFFEDEIPDEGDDDGDGDGDENTRNLSLAEPGLLDKKIDEMMEMMTSIMSMLEIWDEGHGDDDRRDLSPARTDSRDEKIDKLMEMIRSIAPMLEALSERLNRIEVDIAVMKRVNMNKLKVTESPLFKQRIEEAVQHDVAG